MSVRIHEAVAEFDRGDAPPALVPGLVPALAPVLGWRPVPRRARFYPALGKRVLDILFVLIAVPVVLPLVALLALATLKPFVALNEVFDGAESTIQIGADAVSVNPYVYDLVAGKPRRKSIDEARQLLAQAGYPDGRDALTGSHHQPVTDQ